MSSEPEKPIEKLLRRWSSERRGRAGDSWEIHPATRRLWQQEVARKFGHKRPLVISWVSRYLRVGWLGRATALGSVAALIITAWIIWSSPRVSPPAPGMARTQGSQELQDVSGPMQLAANDKAPLSEPAVTLHQEQARDLASADPPVVFDHEKTAPAKTETEKDKGVARESLLDKASTSAGNTSDAIRKEQQQSALAATSTPTPSLAQNSEALQRYGLGGGLQTDNKVASVPSSAVVPLSLSEGEVRQMKEVGPIATLTSAPSGVLITNVVQYGFFSASQTVNTLGRNYAVLRRRSLSAPSASANSQKGLLANGILTSFRVEQAGQELRVIDSDNSVYTGPVRETNLVAGVAIQTAAPALNDPKQKSETLNQQAVSQKVTSFFKVTGTNLTSNQRVVFSGFISDGTNLAIRGRLQNQIAGGMTNFAPGNQPTQNLRLNGTALIGRDQEVQIDAVPVSK